MIDDQQNPNQDTGQEWQTDALTSFGRMDRQLDGSFIYWKDIATAIRYALLSGQNLLLWGPPGHGKSEMVQCALGALFTANQIYTLSIGAGTTEDQLWGGLDIAALNTEKLIRYFPENSFLNRRVAVLEEILDGSDKVLLSLKDTLTARKLQKGTQVFPMKTDIVIGITNHDPSEFQKAGDSHKALLERFPLKLRVAWSTYRNGDYKALFAKTMKKSQGVVFPEDMVTYVAMLFEEIGKTQVPVSPRTAVQAFKIIAAAARSRGATEIDLEDVSAIRFIPEISADPKVILQKISRQQLIDAELARLNKLIDRADERISSLRNANPVDWRGVLSETFVFEALVCSLRLPDAAHELRNKFIRGLELLRTEALGYLVDEAQSGSEEDQNG